MEIIITVLVYSLILTIVECYKDWSGYYETSLLDIIVAGPVAWLLVGVLYIFSLTGIKFKSKTKTYTPKEIKKTVNKVVSVYRKRKYQSEYFNLDLMDCYDYVDIDGWEDLMTKSPKYEWLNRDFERIMLYQEKVGKKELLNYFEELSDSEYEELQLHCCCYDKPLYKIKKG